MKKFIIVVLVLSLILAVPLGNIAYAREAEKNVWVKVEYANIRDGPSTENKVIAGAKRNDKLLVVEEKAKWLKVRLADGKAGWIYEPLCR